MSSPHRLVTVAGMTSQDLTPEQAARMCAVVVRHLNYLGRLRDRMQRRGFPHDDPLVRLVTESWDATHALRVKLHYLSCSSGVGVTQRAS